MTIKKKCSVCNKISAFAKESILGKLKIITYECGHVRAKKIPEAKDLELTSSDNQKPFKYQLQGAEWAIKGDVRVLIADEMGVGKTLQSFLIANSDQNEFCPILIVCKSGLKTQMQREALRWTGWVLQIIDDENEFILPGLKGYIVSYDALAYSEFTNKKGKLVTRGMKDPESWIAKIDPKLIILDECQSVKNLESKRTRAVQKIARHPAHIIALSGTPILNHAGEYFPILNMIQPEKFPNKQAYIARWCESYWASASGTQKIGGIRSPQEFKEYTKDFIIRRTRAEVLPDLPTVSRRFRFEELGEKVELAYKEEFKKFQDFYYYGSSGQTAFQRDGNVLAYLSKMRHLTGIAKIPGVVEFTEEFVSDTDRKLVIFTHHIDLAVQLHHMISGLGINTVYVPSPVDPALIDRFHTPEARVLIGNTLSLGEGWNLQCASDCIIMEREWNPPKEEQAEGRFPRPGQLADKITSTYFVAVGTVDEFFADLVEQKRAIMSSTLDGKEIKWNEAALIQELAEVLASKGGKRWGW